VDTTPDAGAPKPPRPPERPGPPPPIADPTRAAGGAGKIAAKDPNVQILIAGKVLRRSALGAWASSFLVDNPDWRLFFEGSPLDPVRDFDHVLITAPRLKDDTSKMVAVLEYNVPFEVARAAVEAVLHRANGTWVEDAKVTAGRAKVGGAVRIFALVPQRHLLVILPGEAMDQLDRLDQAKGFRNSAEGLIVSMLTPSRPFKEFLPLPESLKWLRASLTPTPDGGVDLAVEAGDQSPDLAQAHAELLTREIEARRKIDLKVTTVEIVDPVPFTATKEVIKARTHLPAHRLQALMDWVAQLAREHYRRR
jgi:hypothetical protein